MRALLVLALLSASCNRQTAACAANVAGALALAGAGAFLRTVAHAAVDSAIAGAVEVGADVDETLPDEPGWERGPIDFQWHPCTGGHRYRLECPEWSSLCYVADSEDRFWRCDHPGCCLPAAFTEWCHREAP